MFVLPEAPKKLYTLYAPDESYFCQLGNEPTNVRCSRKEWVVPPLFVSERHIQKFAPLDSPGYRGNFLFDQRHVDFYSEHGEIWNGTQFPIYSNFLVLDLDKPNDLDIPWLQHTLRDYEYLLYSSGTSGNFHFIIPHNLLCSNNFELIYKALVSVSFVRVDTTLWYPAGMVALPGNKNPSTGVRKELVKANPGKRLWIADASVKCMLELSQKLFNRDGFEKFKRGEL